ncbi:MAG: hypothetical protein JOZ42_05550 [Acetobacteraceae bacterium]|nr:hypothetical protein [Acetobacteraceae bacterium]
MSRAQDGRFLWAGFVALAFGVLGMLAVFATYAAPVPLERAVARDEAFDQLLALAASGAGPGQLDALRPRLADSADAVLGGSGPLEARVARERAAMHGRFSEEARALARQLRLMIAVVTVMCIIFGGAVVAGFSSPRPRPE